MELDTHKHGFDHNPPLSADSISDYWAPEVHDDLSRQNWSLSEIHSKVDLRAWQAVTTDLPRDPYVSQRWKRMSWLALDDVGGVKDLGHCPMAQGGAFNDAESMADRLRYYDPLTADFLERDDVKAFVRAWAGLWGLQPDEPILMQITGQWGNERIDPLQGQGIHADGCQALSILVLSRDNVCGGDSHLYMDKAGSHKLTTAILRPGEILHLRDDRLYHSVDTLSQLDPAKPFERFIIIINSRFVDAFQNRILKRHFPQAVLHQS